MTISWFTLVSREQFYNLWVSNDNDEKFGQNYQDTISCERVCVFLCSLRTRWLQCCAEEQCESMFDCNRNDSKRHFGLLYCFWLWRSTIFSLDKNNKKQTKNCAPECQENCPIVFFFIFIFFLDFVQHQQHNHHVWRYIKPFYFLCVNIHCAKKI